MTQWGSMNLGDKGLTPIQIFRSYYGPKTAATVKKFQEVFRMPVSGKVDYPTWYKISDIFVAVTRLAELQ